MVLSYLGVSTSYRKLLRTLRIQRQYGAPSSNVRYLVRLGVTVVYKTGTLPSLHAHLNHNRPCIAFVQAGELPYWQVQTKHALVVIGIDERFVYVNDPALSAGATPIPHGDFQLAWIEHDEYFATFIT